MLRFRLIALVSAFACVLTLVSAAQAAKPAASLLPATTKGYLSIPNVDELKKKFNESQLGQLAADPLMKPFLDDLKAQLKDKMSQSRVRLGLSMSDLEGVYTGEVCLATIQPGDANSHALAVIVDATGKNDAATALIEKVAKNLIEQKAVRSSVKFGEITATVLTLPKAEKEKDARVAIFFLHQEQLVATNNQTMAEGMAKAMFAERTDSLAKQVAFVESQKHVAEAAAKLEPHVRWFIEPFGYAEVVRASQGGRKKRGTDMLKVLANQGFKAIQGLSGYVNFSTGEHEVLHRTFIYAPAVKRPAGSKVTDKYDLAARLLNFPNTQNLKPQDWIPRELASYNSFNIKTKEAFEFAKTLVDEYAGSEVFEDVLASLKEDPNGPRIDVRKEVIAYLGDRASIITDYRLPITTKSERMLVAVEVTNADKMAAALQKAFEKDPSARKVEVDGHVIWEIINEQPAEVAELKIEGAAPIGEEPAEEEGKLPNSAITVAHGHLLVGTHVDIVKEVLKQPGPGQKLADASDYQAVEHALTALGADSDSLRMFSRIDEELRVTYEMLKEGKMPQSEALLAKILNRMLAPDEEGAVRSQQIDGKNMPEYDAVRRYLGPAGCYGRAFDDGWLLTGCLLSKQQKSE